MAPDVHVLPTLDLLPHDLRVGCWCMPDILRAATGGRRIVHHAADGRDRWEALTDRLELHALRLTAYRIHRQYGSPPS